MPEDEDTPITITKNPNYAAYERQAKDAQNAAQNAASANPAGAVQNAQNAQAANIAKGQAQNAQAQAGNLGLTKPAPKSVPKSAPKSKPAPKPTTGNKALDTMQQIKQEKQPEPVKQAPQAMYDRNGNRIIQGNGTFERRQRQAAGQDQQFQNPTGYDIGAVTNQVTQNQSRYNYGNRRFNNALNYLDNTFANKNVTLDDGSSMSAKEYYQKNLDSLIRNTRNPKALMYGLRSLQEDMARRGVGNFDISGELLKGTGMTDRGFAKELWNNRNNFLIQQQETPKPHNGGTPTPPPPPPKPPKGNTMQQNEEIRKRYAPSVNMPSDYERYLAFIKSANTQKSKLQSRLNTILGQTQGRPTAESRTLEAEISKLDSNIKSWGRKSAAISSKTKYKGASDMYDAIDSSQGD